MVIMSTKRGTSATVTADQAGEAVLLDRLLSLMFSWMRLILGGFCLLAASAHAAPEVLSDSALDTASLSFPRSFPSDSVPPKGLDLHPAAAAATSLALPGLGQILTGHPVKGGVTMALDLTLYGVWSGQVQSVQNYRRRTRASDSAESFWRGQVALLPTDSSARIAAGGDSLDSRRNSAADSAYANRRRVRNAVDNRNLLLAWAVGLHAWSAVDAFDLAYHERHPIQGGRSATIAGLWAAFLPGAGQLYNERFGKAAMLWMAVGGSVTSVISHQNTLEFYQHERDLAVADGRDTADMFSQMNLYRKRRNQYCWGMGILYVYQIIDAVVDARLDNTHNPFRVTVEPHPLGPGLLASVRF